MSLVSNRVVCQVAHLVEAKGEAHLVEAEGEGDDHNDHVDVLQRVLELPNLSIWRSFRIEPNNNHTDDNDTTGEHDTQYCGEIFLHKIRIGRGQIGLTWAKDAPREPIF